MKAGAPRGRAHAFAILRTLNARLELPNREGRRQWQRNDLRAALRLVADVRAATAQTVVEATRSGRSGVA